MATWQRQANQAPALEVFAAVAHAGRGVEHLRLPHEQEAPHAGMAQDGQAGETTHPAPVSRLALVRQDLPASLPAALLPAPAIQFLQKTFRHAGLERGTLAAVHFR